MSVDKIIERIGPILEDLEKTGEVSTRVRIDREAAIVRIYTEGSDYIKRAASGLEEVLELAYTTAEHHPYWSILYHAAELSKAVLEKWESDLSAEKISEMSWRCDEIKMTLERLAAK
jgi:hypothetical protein